MCRCIIGTCVCMRPCTHARGWADRMGIRPAVPSPPTPVACAGPCPGTSMPIADPDHLAAHGILTLSGPINQATVADLIAAILTANLDGGQDRLRRWMCHSSAEKTLKAILQGDSCGFIPASHASGDAMPLRVRALANAASRVAIRCSVSLRHFHRGGGTWVQHPSSTKALAFPSSNSSAAAQAGSASGSGRLRPWMT